MRILLQTVGPDLKERRTAATKKHSEQSKVSNRDGRPTSDFLQSAGLSLSPGNSQEFLDLSIGQNTPACSKLLPLNYNAILDIPGSKPLPSNHPEMSGMECPRRPLPLWNFGGQSEPATFGPSFKMSQCAKEISSHS